MTITRSGRLASIWVVPQDIPVPLYFYTMGFFVYNMVVYLLVEEQLWCFYYHYSEIMALPLLAGVR